LFYGKNADNTANYETDLRRTAERDYLTLNQLTVADVEATSMSKKFIVATKAELLAHRAAAEANAAANAAASQPSMLHQYFQKFPDATLVVMADTENEVFNLSKGDLPATVKKLSLVGDHVRTIGACFLLNCNNLTQIDLLALTNVRTIENNFLEDCSGLKQVDLSGLTNVTTIGDFFICYCSALKQINLSGLRNVTIIGDGFLSGCSGLTQIDLFALMHVTTIGDGFLYECSSLTQIDISVMSALQQAEEEFLFSCSPDLVLTLTKQQCNMLNVLNRDLNTKLKLNIVYKSKKYRRLRTQFIRILNAFTRFVNAHKAG
jgi:hypothetical protein